MSNVTRLLLKDMEVRLSEIQTGKDPLKEYEQAIVTIHNYLNQVTDSFPDFQGNRYEQIEFYKTLMPRFHGHLIYFIRLYQLESALPTGSPGARKRLMRKELKHVVHYFREHEKEYRYYKTGEEAFDDELFMQQQIPSLFLLDETAGFSDHQLCTPTGIIFAKFFAYERLQEYITGNLKRITGSHAGTAGRLHFKGKKIQIAEVLYAWHYAGAFDEEIKQIAEVLGSAVGLDLSNIYRMKSDLYNRQVVSSYLDHLGKVLRKGLDEDDDRNNLR